MAQWFALIETRSRERVDIIIFKALTVWTSSWIDNTSNLCHKSPLQFVCTTLLCRSCTYFVVIFTGKRVTPPSAKQTDVGFFFKKETTGVISVLISVAIKKNWKAEITVRRQLRYWKRVGVWLEHICIVSMNGGTAMWNFNDGRQRIVNIYLYWIAATVCCYFCSYTVNAAQGNVKSLLRIVDIFVSLIPSIKRCLHL